MPTKKPKDSPSPYSDYARYSGIALQFVGIIVFSTWGGHWLDKQLALKFPAFTLIFALLSAVMALYLLIKQLK